jgi:predicted DNA-binding protein (MmcQ/YjbR family)
VSAAKAAAARLLKAALAYPGAWEDHPWDHVVAKVGPKKIFTFVDVGESGALNITVKLPTSNAAALMLPFAEPTGYGLGKSGWISARFPPDQGFPEDLLLAWIDESYRAIAPKKLVKLLDAGGAAPEVKAPAAKKKTKTAAKSAKKTKTATKGAKSAKKKTKTAAKRKTKALATRGRGASPS